MSKEEQQKEVLKNLERFILETGTNMQAISSFMQQASRAFQGMETAWEKQIEKNIELEIRIQTLENHLDQLEKKSRQ